MLRALQSPSEDRLAHAQGGRPQAHGGEISARDREVFNLFEEVARTPELAYRYNLRRGGTLWVDNYRILHGRDAFTDDFPFGKVRRLLRTWVWRHDRPQLPASFSAFCDAIDRDDPYRR